MTRASVSAIEAPLPAVFLRPAMLHCASVPSVITTLLGSCVAVCLWDRARRVGGMNHFVLPSRPAAQADPRYGDSAIDELVAGMLALGCHLEDLEAKIFGGAEVLSFGQPENNVGSKNIAQALARLESHALPVVARRTGGGDGLLIRFSTGTGHVFVRTIPIPAV